MPIRRTVSIATRIALSLLILGVVAIGGACTTYFAMVAQANRVAALTRAADGPRLVERLRAGVYAVVMESRGLYIANDTAQATVFANGLREQLAEIEADWRQLHDLLPDAEQAQSAALEGALTHFISLRSELARLGVEQGAQAAEKLGNNDANRASRVAFSHGLDGLAQATAATVKQLQDESFVAGRKMALELLATTIGVVTLVLGSVLWLLRRTVSRPLRRLAGALGEMAEGLLDGIVLPPASHDEVGSIASAARIFLAKLVRNRELEASATAARAMRDRQTAAMERHTADFSQSVSSAMVSLGASTEGMRKTAGDMARSVESTRSSAAETAAGAEESASNLAAVAAATEQLSASVGEIVRQVAQSAQAARDAVVRANDTDTTVRGLSTAAGQIGDVMKLIADIAAQTNLLALNATIEAARAGEAGKGFAVVASEVKLLAQQTAQATQQIGKQITAIQAATGEAVAAVKGVRAAISRVDEVAVAISAAVEEQGAATREIASSVQVVSRQNASATHAMREVSDAAQGASGSSESVRIAAVEVARVAETLRKEVDQFLTAMASAGESKRRYERIPGRGTRGTVRPRGGADVAVELVDISCGGALLVCGVACPAGSEVELQLLGATGSIAGRVVRSGAGKLALVFRQDEASFACVEQFMKAIETVGAAAA